MKKILSLLLSLFVCSLYSQSSLSYSNTQLIGKLADNIDLYEVNNELKFKDPKVMSFLYNTGLKRISKLSKGKNRRILQDEILLIEFRYDIDILNVIKVISAKELFSYLEPNFIGSIDGECIKIPNDTHFEDRQWAMVNDGSFEAGSVFDGDIDMDSAWLLTTGDSTVTVSILDSGLKLDHEDLIGRIWKNQIEIQGNATDDDGNGYSDDINGWDFVNSDNDPTDDRGHGTNVTGIIGSNGDNNKGYAGVDWNCKLMTCKVIDNTGSGFYSDWISGIYYSVDNGADVINMSLSGSGYSQGMQDAIDYAYNNDVPVVVSMGNGDSSILRYPAAMNNVIAVGAISSNNERASPFTWGGGSNYGSHIDIIAPGNKIFGINYLSSTNYNTFWSGTSQSTPYVTGVVSLLKGVDDTFTVEDIKNLLTQNAIDNLGNSLEDTPGWDQYHGHGLLNAFQTLKQVINILPEPSISYDVQTSCGSYTWLDNIMYTESNDSAFIVLVNSIGCDSTLFLDLTIPEIDTSLIISDSTTLESNAVGVTYQWLDCDQGSTPILGATSKNFTATYNANYAVAITETSCTETSVCYPLKVNVATINIDFLDAFQDVKIYPTSTDGILNIFLSDLKEVEIKIFNLQGKLVFKQDNINQLIKTISLDVVPGVYFTEISNSFGKEVFRIIKK